MYNLRCELMGQDYPEVYAPRWAWLGAGGLVGLSLLHMISSLDSPTRVELVEALAPAVLFAWLFVMSVGYCYRLEWKRETGPLTEWEELYD